MIIIMIVVIQFNGIAFANIIPNERERKLIERARERGTPNTIEMGAMLL